MTTCSATTRTKRNGVNHTVGCTKPAGHHHEPDWEKAKHENLDGAHHVIWGGAPVDLPGDMRFRFERPKFNAEKYVKQYARTFGEE